MGLNREGLPKKFPKIQWRDECILIALFYNSVTQIVQENVIRDHNISRSSFYRRIKKLEQLGLIHKNEKTPLSEYYIDPLYKESNPIFLSLSQGSSPIFKSARRKPSFDERIIRSHNYLFLCSIEHKPAKLDILLRKDNWFENTRMKNWPYFYGNLGLKGIKSYIQFNPKTVNIRILEVYGRDPHEDDQEANRQLMEIKAYLEDKYPRLRLGPGKFLTKTRNTGKHHGWVHHLLALKAKEQNFSLELEHWGLDSSRGIPELDAKNRLQASEHMQRELQDYDYRAEKGVYFEDIDQRQEGIVNIIDNSTKIQKDIMQQFNFLYTGLQTQGQLLLGNLEQSLRLQNEFEKMRQKHNGKLMRFFSKLKDMVRHKGYGKTE